jgi:hypothetical protein
MPFAKVTEEQFSGTQNSGQFDAALNMEQNQQMSAGFNVGGQSQ